MAGVVSISLALGFASAASAGDLLASSWSVWTRQGAPVTEFHWDGAGTTVVADKSWGVRYRKLGPSERGGVLAWSWKVDALHMPAPARDSTHDSRPLAVHVGFDEVPERETFLGALRREVGGLLGFPAWARVLTYSWGGEGPVGTLVVNPYFPDYGYVRILRSQDEPLGAWRDEQVDVRHDFELAFGYPAPAPAYIALSADMDATGGLSRAEIRSLQFRAH